MVCQIPSQGGGKPYGVNAQRLSQLTAHNGVLRPVGGQLASVKLTMVISVRFVPTDASLVATRETRPITAHRTLSSYAGCLWAGIWRSGQSAMGRLLPTLPVYHPSKILKNCDVQYLVENDINNKVKLVMFVLWWYNSKKCPERRLALG